MGTETLFFRGVLTAREEFLYPDTPMAELPCHLELAAPRNGRRGIQLLLETDVREVSLSLSGEGFEPEWFRMIAVPVEYNTGDGVEQGGAMCWKSDRRKNRTTPPAWRLFGCTTA